MVTNYRRTPLPTGVRTPLGWLAFWFALLLAGPFIGFAVHGKVDEAGLAIGLAFAVLPLLGLAALALRRWHRWRRLPPHLLREWREGRLVPADGAPAVAAPVRFAEGRHWLELREEGVVLARSTHLAGGSGLPPIARSWVVDQSGQLFVPWSDIAEWIVDAGDDGPDRHLLALRSGGRVTLRRFRPAGATECDVLDAVRSIGGVPVRLLCDVDGD